MNNWGEEYEAVRQDHYEAAVVRHIIRNYPNVTERDVVACQQGIDGTEALTLVALSTVCNFPLTLVSKKLPHITPTVWLDMMNRPTKCVLYEAFMEASVARPDALDAGTLGLVFAWPKWSQFLVLHNFPSTRYEIGSRTLWFLGPARRLLVLETLDSILLAIGAGRAKKSTRRTADDS